jgi:hypothetical protein
LYPSRHQRLTRTRAAAKVLLSKERTHEPNYKQIIGAALIVFALGGGAGLAQGIMARQDACRPDMFWLCGSYTPDVGQIVGCLRGNK